MRRDYLPLCKTPLTHDKGIIDRNTVDFINAQFQKFRTRLVISWNHLTRTQGSESTGQTKQNDTLSLEIVFRSHILPIKGVFRIFRCCRIDTGASFEGNRWNGITFFQRSGPLGVDRRVQTVRHFCCGHRISLATGVSMDGRYEYLLRRFMLPAIRVSHHGHFYVVCRVEMVVHRAPVKKILPLIV